ncbi:hypothetical protein NWO25_00010 [Enterococcus lactis]|nr:hypothetical protein [Enterococcus lactis]
MIREIIQLSKTVKFLHEIQTVIQNLVSTTNRSIISQSSKETVNGQLGWKRTNDCYKADILCPVTEPD